MKEIVAYATGGALAAAAVFCMFVGLDTLTEPPSLRDGCRMYVHPTGGATVVVSAKTLREFKAGRPIVLRWQDRRTAR